MRLKRRGENKVLRTLVERRILRPRSLVTTILPLLHRITSSWIPSSSLYSLYSSVFAILIQLRPFLGYLSTRESWRGKIREEDFSYSSRSCPFNVARFSSPRTTFSCENVAVASIKEYGRLVPGRPHILVSGRFRGIVVLLGVPTSGKKGRAALFPASAALISRETGIFKFQMDVFARRTLSGWTLVNQLCQRIVYEYSS